jgi:hypothetical protein
MRMGVNGRLFPACRILALGVVVIFVGSLLAFVAASAILWVVFTWFGS